MFVAQASPNPTRFALRVLGNLIDDWPRCPARAAEITSAANGWGVGKTERDWLNAVPRAIAWIHLIAGALNNEGTDWRQP